jgi:hypothetical protein
MSSLFVNCDVPKYEEIINKNKIIAFMVLIKLIKKRIPKNPLLRYLIYNASIPIKLKWVGKYPDKLSNAS